MIIMIMIIMMILMMKMMLTIVMKNDNHEIDDNIDYEHDDMIRMK